ncbi:uncharacterized protein N7525_003141, partial [Penicillium rubens]
MKPLPRFIDRVFSLPRKARLYESADVQSFDDFSGRGFPISFSRDSRTLAYGANNSSIKLRAVMTGVLRQSLERHPQDIEGVSLVSFSPNGQLLASIAFDRTIKLWDPAEDRQYIPKATIGAWCTSTTSRLKVRELTFSPCSRFLASHSGNTIQLWDVDTETDSLRLRHTLDGHLDHLWGPLSFSPNGQLLATSSSDHMLTFRNTRTGSLWLPLEYQPSCFMIHGSVLVL